MTETKEFNNTNSALVVFIEQKNVDEQLKLALISSFATFHQQVEEWKIKAEGIKVTDITQVREMAAARNARLAFKDFRVNVDKIRKELKEEYLRKCQIIDGVAKFITDSIEPIETYLKEQGKYAEILAQKQKDETKAKREAELAKFDIHTEFYDLANMPEDIYQELLLSSEKKFVEAKEAEERAAQEIAEKARLDKLEQERRIEIAPYRQYLHLIEEPDLRNMDEEEYKKLLRTIIETEEVQKLEREKIQKENERLLKEREEQEKKHQEEQERIRKENEAKMEEERKRIQEEQERIRKENEAKMEEEYQKKYEEEQEYFKKKADEQEQAARIEERQKAEEMANRIRSESSTPPRQPEPIVDIEGPEIIDEIPIEEKMQERRDMDDKKDKEQQERDRIAKSGSEKEKLEMVKKDLVKIQLSMPEMETPEGQKIIDDVEILLNKIIGHINKQMATI